MRPSDRELKAAAELGYRPDGAAWRRVWWRRTITWFKWHFVWRRP